MNLFKRFRNQPVKNDLFYELSRLIENMLGHVLKPKEYEILYSLTDEQTQLFIKWMKESEEVS